MYEMVGSIVAMHREKKINDFDLYNSILRLIYSGPKNNREELQKIINWLDAEERNNTPLQEQYHSENVKKNAGENYFEGLKLIAFKDDSNEEKEAEIVFIPNWDNPKPDSKNKWKI